MFGLAYVILPFDGTDPAEAISTSLARYRRGGTDDVPGDWLVFHDETAALGEAYETRFTFTVQEGGGLRVEGPVDRLWHIDDARVRTEMQQRGLRRWTVRFADVLGLDNFVERFGANTMYDPVVCRYGRWLNGLGRWDWWDLGGCFDGWIVGEPGTAPGRSTGRISSGDNPGRRVLSNVLDTVSEAIGQEPPEPVHVSTDRNIELAPTVLANLRATNGQRLASALVLPPRAVEDRLRWIDTWPASKSVEALQSLGLSSASLWRDAIEAVLHRFGDHWVAGIAYHF